MNFDALPTLGLGASLSLAEKPDPLTLVQHPDGPRFVEYSGLVDVDRIWPDVARLKQQGTPILFHPSYINFCGSHGNNSDWLNATQAHIEKVGSPWFAQDCAYCFWGDKPGYSSQFGYFIPPILNANSMNQALSRIQEVMDHIQTPVAIEPPPVTFVVGEMNVFEFFGQLAEKADCALLLDMGHLLSYEMASGITTESQLSALPAERVIEVHVAGGKTRDVEDGPLYIDAHENTVLPDVWNHLQLLLPHLNNLKALCYECEGVEEHAVFDTLNRLRGEILQHAHPQFKSACGDTL